MTDRVKWLHQQIDEDERIAKAAAHGGRWRYSGGETVGAWTLHDEHWSIASMTLYDTEQYNYSERMPAFRNPGYINPDAIGAHMALNDPDRALREVEAKRRRLRLIESMLENPPTRVDGPWAAEAYKGDALVAYGLLRVEALPYAARPGYQEMWGSSD
ncbi:DUF6221 family protein [Micromonospora sp. NPDC000207]|uniref:DUF6221 family protein n=1 Tax=Micromonospora sp. NPDC000207 TaxID=3154246 RepID=UPI00331E38A7